MSRSPTKRLADGKLREPVEQWIIRHRTPADGPRVSWNRLALLLWDETEHEVLISGQTVQTWAEAATREDAQ